MKASYASKMKFHKWRKVLAMFMLASLLAGEVSLPIQAAGTEMLENAIISNEAEIESAEESANEETVSVESEEAESTEVEAEISTESEAVTDTENQDSTTTESERVEESISETVEIFEDILASGSCGTDANWILTSDGVLTISGSGAMSDNDGNVMEWFDYKESITSIVIEDGITYIGNWTFASLENLNSIDIAASVTTIGEGAFNYCGIKEIILPEGIVSIGDYAFYLCKKLQRVLIPSTVTSIGESAFIACDSMISIEVDINNVNYSSLDGVLFDKEQSILIKYPDNLSGSYVVPDSVETIEANAFASSKLSYVTLSNNISTIGDYAFQNSENLLTITIPGSVENVSKGAFYFCTGLTEVIVEEGVIGIQDNAFENCSGIIKILLPDSIQTIGKWAFSGCTKMSDMIIPDKVTDIGSYAFKNCRSLTSITIPKNMTYINESAFYFCDGLKEVVIPNSITQIGDWAFYLYGNMVISNVYYDGTQEQWEAIGIGEHNESLTAAVVHFQEESVLASGTCGTDVSWVLSEDGVLTISGNGSMDECSGDSRPWIEYSNTIKSVVILDGVTSIAEYAFYGCSNLAEVIIPDSITSIEWYAFYECANLKEISIPGSITEIGILAFGGCTSLEKVNISNGVTSIGMNAFNGCSALTEMVIPDSVTNLDGSVFFGCNNLKSVELSKNITCVKSFMFYNCSSLTEVILPDNVTGIERYAFSGCSNLKDINIPENVTTIEAFAFNSVNCVENVCYGGNEENWNTINIGEGNDTLTNANVYYDSDIIFYDIGDNNNIVLRCAVSENDACTIIGCNEDAIGELIIPNEIYGKSVLKIGNSAFYSCTGLTSVVLPDTLSGIGTYAFHICNGITSIEIPESVQSIGDYAFYFCRSLEEINLPSTLSEIKPGTFSDCSSLVDLEIPETVTYIGANAFAGCNSLSSIDIPENISIIDDYVFYYCKSLTSIEIPGNVTEINPYAFMNCLNLVSIYLPDTITSIGDAAFFLCDSLSNVYYEGTEEQWNLISIEGSNDALYNASIYYNGENPLDGARELLLDQVTGVVIEEAGDIAYFSFIPERTGYYSLESFGNYDTYVNVKDSAGNYICSDDDGGDANNFKTYEKLIAGEKYIFEVRFYSGTLTGSFEICLSEAIEIVEVVAEYSSYNNGKLYYGLNLRQYHSVANGLIFKTIYKDGTVESVAYENGAYNYFFINITDKETGNYVDYDENGYMPIGTYTITIQSKLNDELTDTIEVQVLPPEELDLTLTLESPVTNLLGYASNTSGIMPYSCFKIEIPAEGRYELASTESNCYGALYDENMIPVIGGANSYYSMDLITIEADSAATYYMVTYANSAREYDISMSKQKEMVSLSVVEPYTDTLYNVMGNNSVSNVISSKVGLLATLDDKSEVFFNVYSNEWRNYGLSYNLYASDNLDEPIISSERSNLPIGEYEIHITSSVYENILCIIPFEVTTADQAEEITFGEEISNSVITAVYKVEVETNGAYELKYGDNCSFYAQVGRASGDSVIRYLSKSCSGTGSSYVQLEQGTNYILIRNYKTPDSYKFSLHKMPTIVSLEHMDEEKPTFEYGYWGYYVRESVSGGKVTVSSSGNKRPLVSNSPVDYYQTVSGMATTTRVSAFNFDVNLEAECDDGSIVEMFCNSFLWQAYDLLQSVLNLDGSPLYTDQNGFVEIGDYIVEFSVGDVSVEIPFSVTESDTVKDIRKANVEIEDQMYTGEAITPIPIVTYNNTLLTKGKDYIVLYKNNIEAGTATATIKGINGYSATLNVEFAIIKSKPIANGYSGYTTWTLTDDGVLTFSGEGNMRNYTYKSEMPWYKYIEQITSVVLEEGVTSISNYAFYGMPNLKSVTIPESVTTIGTYAFKNCTALNDIVLPDKLTKLGESAFYGCTALTAIEIPASLWTIQPYTFKNCTALAEVTLYEGNLMKISEAAFYGTALSEVTLPDCLDILDIYVFKNCSKLTTVTLSESMTQIREAAFYGTAIKEIEMPDSITSIGNYAFRKCEALQSVQFSQNLVTIGESSFYGCTALTELSIPESVTTIKGYAFKSCTAITSVSLPSALVTLGESAFYGCAALTEIVIPENVATVGEYCFSRNSVLTKITFRGNAPSIGSGAFSKVIGDVYYPVDNTTWTSEVMQNYGGTLNWETM